MLEEHARSYEIGTCFWLQMKEQQFEQCLDGMKKLMGPAKLKEIYLDIFAAAWGRMKNVNEELTAGRPFPAKYCAPKRFDEMSTETNDGDIVRVLRKQMEEMNLQMSVMIKINEVAILEHLAPPVLPLHHEELISLHPLCCQQLMALLYNHQHKDLMKIRNSLEVETPTTES